MRGMREDGATRRMQWPLPPCPFDTPLVTPMSSHAVNEPNDSFDALPATSPPPAPDKPSGSSDTLLALITRHRNSKDEGDDGTTASIRAHCVPTRPPPTIDESSGSVDALHGGDDPR